MIVVGDDQDYGSALLSVSTNSTHIVVRIVVVIVGG